MMPEKIELGLFYAPAPMSEYFYSVIDDKTKMTPQARAQYTCSDIAEARIAGLEAEVERLRGALELCLTAIGDYGVRLKFQDGNFTADHVAYLHKIDVEKQLKDAFYAAQKALKETK